MRVLLFGATGMVGGGVLRWLIASPQVDRVVAVSRKQLGVQHPKLEVVIEADMFHLKNIDSLKGFDACFYCLGVSSVGMKEAEYRHFTRDLTVAVARQLLPGNPRMVFELVSGERADLHGRQMWLRVKAEADDALLGIGFHDAYVLRPGFIQPMGGAVSSNRWVRWIYPVTGAIYPFLQRRFDRAVTSTDLIAKAMLQLATTGNVKKILRTGELNEIARSFSAATSTATPLDTRAQPPRARSTKTP
jgi:hypothetical protein